MLLGERVHRRKRRKITPNSLKKRISGKKRDEKGENRSPNYSREEQRPKRPKKISNEPTQGSSKSTAAEKKQLKVSQQERIERIEESD